MQQQFGMLQDQLHVLTARNSTPQRAPLCELDQRTKADLDLGHDDATHEPAPVSLPAEMSEAGFTAVVQRLLNDPALREQCERGLTAQLQRTKDGATSETRIQELAGIVKTLRRCLREMLSRSNTLMQRAEQVWHVAAPTPHMHTRGTDGFNAVGGSSQARVWHAPI